MNSTSRGSRLVRMAARSPALASTGPEVARKFTPSSRATIWARVVLPRPGGPNSSTWSSASPRARAASMNTFRLALACAWPTNSARVCGRSARSGGLDGGGSPETRRGSPAELLQRRLDQRRLARVFAQAQQRPARPRGAPTGSATPRPISAATASPAADGAGGGRGRAGVEGRHVPSAIGLSFSSATMRSASFGPDAVGPRHRRLVARAAPRRPARRRQHIQHRQRRLGPDALDVLQGDEGARAPRGSGSRRAAAPAASRPLRSRRAARASSPIAGSRASVREPQRTT